ncbi:MAG: VPLPA-CTERM sorting domain-containing protein [Phycisphaerales bacterium]|nr:VPLPA-CTERM sorting domain-containing protein [Phycisphaerales bacterium]
MMNKKMMFGAALAVAGLGASAHAGTVVIDGLGGPVYMQSTSIPGVFGAGTPTFTNAALNLVHDNLHADGITTDGLVTFILADTDNGLTWMTLVDDITIGSGAANIDSSLGMTSTAPDTGVDFINDVNSDITQSFLPGNGTQVAAGTFNWDDQKYGDAFAWANLMEGDFVSFNFNRYQNTTPGLNADDTFQFVTWNGSSWEVVTTGEFTNNNQFAYSFTVVPLPAPALIGLAGLSGLGILRRRALRKA